ncbi:hypothetical protein KW790_00395 [Candidatus Parcubacteria bacterium]|nr:hypothetical protein [Candidatus Parcubacteria bacterium]
MATTIVGVFDNRVSADSAINELRSIGIPDAEISYMYAAPEGDIKATHSTGERMGTRAASGAGTGAILGAIAGFVVANGILPGLGTLFVAGPLAAALGLTGVAATTAAGALTGAAAGGIIGALSGLGVSESDARMYEERVRRGGILLVVNSVAANAAREIMKKFGAEEIREYSAA